MKTRLIPIATTALLLAGALLPFEAPHAATATATATASATIISPSDVAGDAASELLKRASTGMFTIGIPKASGTDDDEVEDMALSSIWIRGTTIVISTRDSTPKASLVLALATSAAGMNGILSTGQGVNLSITHVEEDGTGKGSVYAIIAYN